VDNIKALNQGFFSGHLLLATGSGAQFLILALARMGWGYFNEEEIFVAFSHAATV